MPVPHNPGQNRILAALPAAEFKRLSPHLELVPMPLGESYYEAGGKLQHVYFPTTAIVSLHYVMENGAPAEISGVGNEGMLGISLFMGGKATPRRASVRTVGYGYRLKARLLLDEFNRAGTLQHVLLAYTKTLITQASHTVICNRYHPVERRVCRWLLLTLDRMSSNEVDISHELLASMLGVRRHVIAEALRELQQSGLVRHRYGHIVVPNRDELEQHACECYAAIRQESQRLVPERDWGRVSESVNSRSRLKTGVCAQM